MFCQICAVILLNTGYFYLFRHLKILQMKQAGQKISLWLTCSEVTSLVIRCHCFILRYAQPKKVENYCFTSIPLLNLTLSYIFIVCTHLHTMCGRGGAKQHMLCWHASLMPELWVMKTSITQPVIKHSQRPLQEGSFFWISKEIRGIRGRTKWTRTLEKQTLVKTGKNEKTTQSYSGML